MEHEVDELTLAYNNLRKFGKAHAVEVGSYQHRLENLLIAMYARIKQLEFDIGELERKADSTADALMDTGTMRVGGDR